MKCNSKPITWSQFALHEKLLGQANHRSYMYGPWRVMYMK